MSQTKKAVTKSASIPAEMSLVDRVLKTLMSCGSSEIVVSVAPINPSVIIKSILPFLLAKRHIYSFLGVWHVMNIRKELRKKLIKQQALSNFRRF
jgi:hypothetical protein